MTSPAPDSDQKKHIRMSSDRILVQPDGEPGERRSRGGIVIPATAAIAKRLEWAEVVAVGPSVRSIEVGDSILFATEDAFDVEIRGDEYQIIRLPDVHAVASADEDETLGLYL